MGNSNSCPRAQFARKLQFCLVDIDAENSAAISFEQLNGDLPQQAQTDYDDRFAERRRRKPDALKRDRAERS